MPQKMLQITLVVCACVALAIAGQAPHSEYVRGLISNGVIDSRFSDNILEDASLDVPDLIRKYGYPLEEHEMTTDDGYILRMHRIPHGRDKNNKPDPKKPVVFVMHGLLSSSADWVLMGPGSGLAYLLAEEGYDVWMGNARGNYYSRRHTSLNPDAIFSTAYWQFSWDEIGNVDLPTMIDYALAHTGRDRLHYVGHSQGNTAFWVMASLRPEYNDKIISMHALAPVAYMANNKSFLLRVIASFGNDIEKIASLVGIGEFLPNNLILSWAGQALCMDGQVMQSICSNIMFLVGGWNEEQHNSTMLPVILGHTPAGASMRQFVHFGQSINDGGFRRYDHGLLANKRQYGSFKPPKYDLSKVKAPVFLHYADQDPLAHVKDVTRLFKELGRPVGLFRVSVSKFSHLDFMWGIDAKNLIYDRVINLIHTMDASNADVFDMST